MSRLRRSLTARLVVAVLVSATVVVSAGAAEDSNKRLRSTLFVGIDTSGSFRAAYDDAFARWSAIYPRILGLAEDRLAAPMWWPAGADASAVTTPSEPSIA